jgi:hypothetical protein
MILAKFILGDFAGAFGAQHAIRALRPVPRGVHLAQPVHADLTAVAVLGRVTAEERIDAAAPTAALAEAAGDPPTPLALRLLLLFLLTLALAFLLAPGFAFQLGLRQEAGQAADGGADDNAEG